MKKNKAPDPMDLSEVLISVNVALKDTISPFSTFDGSVDESIETEYKDESASESDSDSDSDTDSDSDSESDDEEETYGPSVPDGIVVRRPSKPKKGAKKSKTYKLGKTSTKIDIDDAISHISKMAKLLPDGTSPPVIPMVERCDSRNTLPPVKVDPEMIANLRATMSKKDFRVMYEAVMGVSLPDAEETDDAREDTNGSSGRREEEPSGRDEVVGNQTFHRWGAASNGSTLETDLMTEHEYVTEGTQKSKDSHEGLDDKTSSDSSPTLETNATANVAKPGNPISPSGSSFGRSFKRMFQRGKKTQAAMASPPGRKSPPPQLHFTSARKNRSRKNNPQVVAKDSSSLPPRIKPAASPNEHVEQKDVASEPSTKTTDVTMKDTLTVDVPTGGSTSNPEEHMAPTPKAGSKTKKSDSNIIKPPECIADRENSKSKVSPNANTEGKKSPVTLGSNTASAGNKTMTEEQSLEDVINGLAAEGFASTKGFSDEVESGAMTAGELPSAANDKLSRASPKPSNGTKTSLASPGAESKAPRASPTSSKGNKDAIRTNYQTATPLNVDRPSVGLNDDEISSKTSNKGTAISKVNSKRSRRGNASLRSFDECATASITEQSFSIITQVVSTIAGGTVGGSAARATPDDVERKDDTKDDYDCFSVESLESDLSQESDYTDNSSYRSGSRESILMDDCTLEHNSLGGYQSCNPFAARGDNGLPEIYNWITTLENSIFCNDHYFEGSSSAPDTEHEEAPIIVEYDSKTKNHFTSSRSDISKLEAKSIKSRRSSKVRSSSKLAQNNHSKPEEPKKKSHTRKNLSSSRSFGSSKINKLETQSKTPHRSSRVRSSSKPPIKTRSQLNEHSKVNKIAESPQARKNTSSSPPLASSKNSKLESKSIKFHRSSRVRSSSDQPPIKTSETRKHSPAKTMKKMEKVKKGSGSSSKKPVKKSEKKDRVLSDSKKVSKGGKAEEARVSKAWQSPNPEPLGKSACKEGETSKKIVPKQPKKSASKNEKRQKAVSQTPNEPERQNEKTSRSAAPTDRSSGQGRSKSIGRSEVSKSLVSPLKRSKSKTR